MRPPLRRPLSNVKATILTVLLLIVGTVLTMLAASALLGQGATDYWTVCLAMVANSLLLFALPGIVSRRIVVGHNISKFTPKRASNYIGLSLVVSTVILSFICQPLISWAEYAGEQLCAWSPIRELLGESDNTATYLLLAQVIKFDNIGQWAVAITVVALLPAVSEELFFRGALMPLIKRNTKSWHLAIIFSALIFSLLHMDAEGFLARTILGSILGILFWLTKRLWVPVLFHFSNNLSVIVSLYMADTSVADTLSQPAEDPGLWLPILSVLLTLSEIHFIGITTGYHHLPSLEELDDLEKKLRK